MCTLSVCCSTIDLAVSPTIFQPIDVHCPGDSQSSNTSLLLKPLEISRLGPSPDPHKQQEWPHQSRISARCTPWPFDAFVELREDVDELQQSKTPLDCATYAALLQKCGSLQALPEGREVHEHITRQRLDQNTFLLNHLIEMYSKCGAIHTARFVFDEIQHRNVFSWTIMISAYVEHMECENALLLFRQMALEGEKPNNVTFVSVLGACISNDALPQGRLLHVDIVAAGYEHDVVVGTALVNMYGKCGSVEEAYRVFHRLHVKNQVTWNAMIEACVKHGCHIEVFQLLQGMTQSGMEPDNLTFVSTLGACVTLEQGRYVHAQIVGSGYEVDAVVRSALINMYGKAESLDDARVIFDKLHVYTVGMWNAMITAYTESGCGKHAIQLFLALQSQGLNPDKVTFISVLGACCDQAALAHGKLIHSQLIYSGLILDSVLGTALVTMYGKCGNVLDARSVFDGMSSHDLAAWNAMITVYTQHGNGKEVFHLFSQMQESELKPDAVTFVCILSVCSRAGLVDKGLQYFLSMCNVYGITPRVEHYGCMIDLFGRAGLLEEAEEFLKKIGVQDNLVIWETLLAASQVHGDVRGGKQFAKRVIELNPTNSAPYVLLSNIYAAEGLWDEVAKVRKSMACNGVKVELGRSWIEIDNIIHEFTVSDKSHPQATEIYAELETLGELMIEVGYMHDTKLCLHDVEDELKEQVIRYHSEKLALSYGLISTPPGTPLQINKNLRVCSHCHSAYKAISKLVGRKLLLRDSKCSHEFIDGVCSCGDYW